MSFSRGYSSKCNVRTSWRSGSLVWMSKHIVCISNERVAEIFFWYITSAVYCIELKSSQLPSPTQNESAFNNSDQVDSNSLKRTALFIHVSESDDRMPVH